MSGVVANPLMVNRGGRWDPGLANIEVITKRGVVLAVIVCVLVVEPVVSLQVSSFVLVPGVGWLGCCVNEDGGYRGSPIIVGRRPG